MYVYIYIYVYTFIFSLSLYIYIYIYLLICISIIYKLFYYQALVFGRLGSCVYNVFMFEFVGNCITCFQRCVILAQARVSVWGA